MSFDERNIIIDVRNISKRYELYRKPIHRLYQTIFMGRKQFFREFWALRNINFQVRKGESIELSGKTERGNQPFFKFSLEHYGRQQERLISEARLQLF